MVQVFSILIISSGSQYCLASGMDGVLYSRGDFRQLAEGQVGQVYPFTLHTCGRLLVDMLPEWSRLETQRGPNQAGVC